MKENITFTGYCDGIIMDSKEGLTLIEVKYFPSLKYHTIKEIAQRGYSSYLYFDGKIQIRKESYLYCQIQLYLLLYGLDRGIGILAAKDKIEILVVKDV